MEYQSLGRKPSTIHAVSTNRPMQKTDFYHLAISEMWMKFRNTSWKSLKTTLEESWISSGDLSNCAALFKDWTSCKKRLSGRPVGWSGGLYRCVAPLYRRIALTQAAFVKSPPGASRGLPGASLGVYQCHTLQIDQKFVVSMLRAAWSFVLNFENEPLTLLLQPYDTSNLFNGHLSLWM